MSKILVLAVHPDDESLGCGGTLLKHKSIGDEIHWLIATGMDSNNGFSESDIKARNYEIDAVAKLFGFESLHKLGLPTGMVDTVPLKSIIGMIKDQLENIKPDVVYLPFRYDTHSDHRILSDAAYSAMKSFRNSFIRKVFMMEVLSESEFAMPLKDTVFIPNYFVDITDFIKEKIRACSIYTKEMGVHPFPRSPKSIGALAAYRGSMSRCAAAEGFMLLKEIW